MTKLDKEVMEIIETLHPLERKVIPYLSKNDSLDELEKASKLKQVEIMRALQWLENKKVLEIISSSKEFVTLDDNGINYIEKGLPEYRFIESVKRGASSIPEIIKQGLEKQEVNVCIGMLKKQRLINFEKGKITLTNNEYKDIISKFLKRLEKEIPIDSLLNSEKELVKELQKRKKIIKIIEKKSKNIRLTDLGRELLKVKIENIEVLDKLSSDMLKKGSWKNKKFRKYDIKVNVPKIYGGKRHFVDSAVNYIKKIWLEMGFKEMEGNMMQTSFWNMDALFIPQDHPARAMQDTFYIKNPNKGTLPKDYKKIKDVHENGADTGSTGWKNKWDPEIAKENLLRTHTTVLSAQTIANIKKEDLPLKFFSVGKVFRNETLDWSHLFEFYQVEGIVISEDVNFKHLKGYLKEFYKKMGYADVRMRPAHFPYTEPSVEVDVLHPIQNTWIELGGAGIFRPEVVKPLLGIDVPVLAWGNGLGRIISAYYDLKDIRDLYKNDLKQIREMKAWLK